MAQENYDPKKTALLLVDLYNDFVSEGGKLWPKIQKSAEKVGLLENLRALVKGARRAGIRIYIVPHRRWMPGDLSDWKNATPYQLMVAKLGVFAKDTWGGTFHDDFQAQPGDMVASEHWGSSGFANTDLDYQLKQFNIQKIVVVGLAANTCIEATGRFGMELGYHVTLIRDATAAFTEEAMHAAHEIDGPTFAHEILTTGEWLKAIPAS